jgi:hypothetical protein
VDNTCLEPLLYLVDNTCLEPHRERAREVRQSLVVPPLLQRCKLILIANFESGSSLYSFKR